MAGETQGSAGTMPDAGADSRRRSFTSPDKGGSWRVLDTADEVYPGRAHDDHDLDDYDELLKAGRERLAPNVRSQVAVLPKKLSDTQTDVELVLLSKGSMKNEHRKAILDGAMKTKDMSNEHFLQTVQSRLARVGIRLPSVEVRFENLTVEAQAEAAGRELPSIFNSYRSWVEGVLQKLRIMRSTKKRINILSGLSGTIKPGRLTLLLGPPSSGKTTLLKALAGKLRGTGLKVRGDVKYNGYGFDECVVGRTAAYVDQNDNHIAELTVRETLDFAARVQGAGFDEIHELRKREKEQGHEPDWEMEYFMKASAARGKRHSIMTDYVMRMLGLEICADTMIGNQLIRGISGGQKKRVTTGEIVVGPCKTLFMDEISTGLDSSTTYQIVSCIRNMVRMRNSTVCMSLLQPQRETYNLFDDVLLLADGCLVYHGPREQVVPFFESLGFRLPPRKGTADFLQEITSKKDQQQYWAKEAGPYRFIPAAEMAEAFQNSAEGRAAAKELAQPPERTKQGHDALVHKRYALSAWKSMKACMRREVILVRRHSFTYIFRIAQLVVVAIAASTVYLRTRMGTSTLEDGRLFLAFLFYGSYFANASAWSELSVTLSTISVFYKQRNNFFFPVTSYALPTVLLRVPLSIVTGIIFTALTYFVVGFAPDAGRLFEYFAIITLINQVGITVFRAIAAIGRAVVLCNVLAFVYIAYALLLCGFIIPLDSLHPWVVWLYYLNPLTYAFRAVVVSEFSAPRWDHPAPSDPSVRAGTAVLQANALDLPTLWTWASVLLLVGYIIVINIVVVLGLKLLNELGGKKAMLAEEVVMDAGELSTSRENKSSKSLATADGRSSKKLASHREDGAALNGAREDALPPELDLEAQAVEGGSRKGMILPFIRLAITFRDIHYYVAMPEAKAGGPRELELLKGITGAFQPGVLTALMGASGAGKTTFMDVLAGRKNSGRISGEVRINGYPQEQKTWARVSGYVEQSDIHSPQATVEEALWFSARLRLTRDTSNRVMWAFIYEVMELVELIPLRNALVGLPGVSGLSVEQRKRLTIAVELVANPSAVFMDEPTSGLDARAANIVMRVVRNVADTGRTIVCTIHQPAIDIFEAFDTMLLLKRGGETIYNGPLGFQSADMISYFEAIQGVPHIKPTSNPATWMLEISTVSAEERAGADLAQVYQHSNLCRNITGLVDRLSQPEPGSQPLAFESEHAQSLFGQYCVLLRKGTVSYWRNPGYNAVRFTFTVLYGVLMGAAFWALGSNRSTENGVLQVGASQYMAALIIGFVNSATIQPVIAIERIVYHRERAAGMYAAMPYALAQGDVEVPYLVVQTLLWSVITYWMFGFEASAGKFWWYTLYIFLTLMYYTYAGLVAIVIAPSLQVSSVACTIFYALWNLFSGVLITLPQVPVWWVWAMYIDPVFWSINGLVGTQLGDVEETMVLQNGSVTKVSTYIRQHFGFDYKLRGWIILILLAYVVVFRLCAILGVTKLTFVKR